MSPEGPVYSGPTNIYLAYPVQVLLNTTRGLLNLQTSSRPFTLFFFVWLVSSSFPHQCPRARTVAATSPSRSPALPTRRAPSPATPPTATPAPPTHPTQVSRTPFPPSRTLPLRPRTYLQHDQRSVHIGSANAKCQTSEFVHLILPCCVA